MSNGGWVKLHRKILRNPIFKNDKIFRVFIYVLLDVQHTESDLLINDSIVHVKAGQCVTGRKTISDNTGLTEQNVRTALLKLEKLGIITIKPTTKFSIISITKWSEYQQDNQQVTNSQPTANQQATTYKNDKKEKNDQEGKELISDSGKPPSTDKFTDEDLRFSEWFYQTLLASNPEMKKPTLKSKSWADSIRLMREQDKRTYDQMAGLLTWTVAHNFWSGIVQNPKKLRDKWDQLTKQRDNESKRQPQKNQWGNTDALAGEFSKMLNDGDINL